jgi:Flp pilus assembly pilin Flp
VALLQLLAWLESRAPAADEEGQGGLEYALVAGVVVVAIVIAFRDFGVDDIINSALNKVKGLIDGGGTPA